MLINNANYAEIANTSYQLKGHKFILSVTYNDEDATKGDRRRDARPAPPDANKLSDIILLLV